MKRALTAVLVLAAWACTSPESTRTQGGGPGADVGNRGDEVLMHEGSRPFAGTPLRMPRQAASAPDESARQAHRLSER